MIVPLKTSIDRLDAEERFSVDSEFAVAPPTRYRVEVLAYDTEKRAYRRYEFHSMVDPTQPEGQEVGLVTFAQTPTPQDVEYLRRLRDDLDKMLGDGSALARVEQLEAERRSVLAAVNLFGDEVLHQALDDVGWPAASDEGS